MYPAIPGPINLDKLNPAEDIATPLDSCFDETSDGINASLTGE